MPTAGRTGVANLPLHYGKAPRWLFRRMVKLARQITFAIVSDFGPHEILERLSHPYWFQILGCVLGYDRSIELLKGANRKSRLEMTEKEGALKRLLNGRIMSRSD